MTCLTTFIILIVWKLISNVSSHFVGCSYYHEAAAADEVTWRCNNITLNPINLEKSVNIEMLNSTNITVMSFESDNGNFDSNLIQNFTQLKVLLFVDNNFQKFNLESNIIETLGIIRTVLPNDTKLANCCSKLNGLMLKSNKGLNLESNGFSGLKRLHKLDMTFQELKHITKDTFKGLTRLKILTMTNCSIESIAEGSFDDLYNLKELYIEDNSLKNITMGVLDSMTKLTSLTIYGDNIPPLPLRFFKNQRKLMQIGLPLNTWRVIDVEQIPVMFPRLNFFSYIGAWESEEDKINTKKRVFRKLSKLLANSERYS